MDDPIRQGNTAFSFIRIGRQVKIGRQARDSLQASRSDDFIDQVRITTQQDSRNTSLARCQRENRLLGFRLNLLANLRQLLQLRLNRLSAAQLRFVQNPRNLLFSRIDESPRQLRVQPGNRS